MTQQENNMKNPIGVAIAGLGFGESVHIPALKENPEFELTALWHHRNSRLKDACSKYQVKGYSDWDSLLKDSSINAIIIATPPEPRFRLASTALKAGKHLLLEKPVGLNSKEIIELQKMAIQKKLSVAVDFEYRAVPLFMQTKRLIDSGFIGDPWLVKFDWLMSSRADKARPWNWYSQAEKGGGVLGALGTHAFDMLHWFMGPTEKANGLVSTSIKERIDINSQKLLKVTSEDIALAQLEMFCVRSKLTFPAQVNLSAVTRQGRGCWIEFYGSEGTVILGSENQKDYVHGFGLWQAKAGEQAKSLTPAKDLKFTTSWTDGRIAPVSRLQSWWAKSIISGQPMVPGLAEGLASQKICDQIRGSENYHKDDQYKYSLS